MSRINLAKKFEIEDIIALNFQGVRNDRFLNPGILSYGHHGVQSQYPSQCENTLKGRKRKSPDFFQSSEYFQQQKYPNSTNQKSQGVLGENQVIKKFKFSSAILFSIELILCLDVMESNTQFPISSDLQWTISSSTQNHSKDGTCKSRVTHST